MGLEKFWGVLVPRAAEDGMDDLPQPDIQFLSLHNVTVHQLLTQLYDSMLPHMVSLHHDLKGW
jgi:hypothetical protein